MSKRKRGGGRRKQPQAKKQNKKPKQTNTKKKGKRVWEWGPDEIPIAEIWDAVFGNMTEQPLVYRATVDAELISDDCIQEGLLREVTPGMMQASAGKYLAVTDET